MASRGESLTPDAIAERIIESTSGMFLPIGSTETLKAAIVGAIKRERQQRRPFTRLESEIRDRYKYALDALRKIREEAKIDMMCVAGNRHGCITCRKCGLHCPICKPKCPRQTQLGPRPRW